MKRISLHALLFAVALYGIVSCSRTSNNINNGQVIATPFTMYYSDSAGVLYNTNDGKNYKVIFTSDGKPSRALCYMGNTLLWIKGQDIALPGPTMYYSTDNGKNFNRNFDSITSIPNTAVNGKKINLNQSMIIYLPSWDAGYCVTNNPDPANTFGLAGNPHRGLPGEWIRENYYDTIQITDPHNISATSLTATKSSVLFAYDAVHQRTFFRTALLDRWKEKFPGSATLPPPPASFFSIGHLNEMIIAIDNIGAAGAYYSNDAGANWTAFTGIPTNLPLMCVCSPFEQVCLIGTDGMGVYMLNPNTNVFEPRNNGMPANASVRGITFKEDIFKNGNHSKYVFATTNMGLYQSVDMGNTWVKTIPGNFVSIY